MTRNPQKLQEDPGLTKRLRLVVGDRSFRDVARMTGLSAESVRRYLGGAIPSAEFLGALCEKLAINAEWLLTGQGPMRMDAVLAEALREADTLQIVAEIAKKFDGLSDRVTRLEVAVLAGESPRAPGRREPPVSP